MCHIGVQLHMSACTSSKRVCGHLVAACSLSRIALLSAAYTQPAKASVKPLLRPKFPCSQKNQGSVDKQAAKEQQVAEGRAARYMQQAATLTCHHHHHTLQLGPEGAEPQAHVVLGDKGKHRPVGTR